MFMVDKVKLRKHIQKVHMLKYLTKMVKKKSTKYYTNRQLVKLAAKRGIETKRRRNSRQ